MKARVYIKAIYFNSHGLSMDIETDDIVGPPDNPNPPNPPDPPNPPVDTYARPLPDGYDTNEKVALDMLLDAMNAAGLNAVQVQRHGDWIANALNKRYPGLNAYPHPQSDAVMWPRFGSLDVTISSGVGGFYFRPDRLAPYDPVAAQAYVRAHPQ
jgi:hypothetical protein